MKKIISIILLLCAVCFTACTGRDQDVLHLGLDAKVVEVDAEHPALKVRMKIKTDETNPKPQEILIDCSDADLMYCDYKTHEVSSIEFGEFQPGDDVILSIYESQMKNAECGTLKAHQVQLGTQRLKESD